MIFLNDLSIKIKSLYSSAIVILVILVYTITNIIKVNYFFKYGIEAKASVTDEYYVTPIKYLMIHKALARWNGGDEKNGVIYKYKIESETYENKYQFIINNETMSIKQGSILTILANPKNKNDTIIMDIFLKYSV